MPWSLRFASGVVKDLRKIDRADARFIIDSLQPFARDFRDRDEAELRKSGMVKELTGKWKGLYRLRLRSYRAIYKKYGETLVILVVRVAHRKEAYR
jgi:mRNA interferase RelE/StbE